MAKSDSNESGWTKWKSGLKAEFNKIIWPNREDVRKETIAVVVVSIIVGVLIAMIDFLVQHGIDFLINIKF